MNRNYISPYNDPQVIGGQGTIAVELAGQLDHIDVVYAALGGGGLISGIAGHFQVRDQITLTMQDQLDRFAADLIARFEDPTVDPTLAAGDAGLFTDAGGVLNPANLEGLAGRLVLNPLADPQA